MRQVKESFPLHIDSEVSACLKRSANGWLIVYVRTANKTHNALRRLECIVTCIVRRRAVSRRVVRQVEALAKGHYSLFS